MNKLNAIWQENKLFLLFIGLMVMFRSAVADWNHVPTGSMQPTIKIGDQILVDKLAYDIRLPLTHVSLHKLNDPERGDVIIFDSKVSDKRLVKRVIGVPGDRVAMKNNRLFVNGNALKYTAVSEQGGFKVLNEVLGETTHKIRIRNANTRASNFAEVTVPSGHYLVLGDNRDNSADSRAIGFIPRNEIVGKSETVAFSLDYDNYYLPRSQRVISPLDET
ncbi:signal peptidase I [Planctobacterium marinum]|uniref:Signal peptidase I n=1 Tax=Planctobacterium marinum TaxID=1631968 RepID=A0AA48KR21_9ALTE|nr:signal peptidase I [Planctobacterium marinum]